VAVDCSERRRTCQCAIMSGEMSDEPPSKVLGALPRTRPHRRSDKRAAPTGDLVSVKHPPTPAPGTQASMNTPPPAGANVLGTAVQAAAELAEIGLSLSARALRGALSRLPRP